MKIALCMLAWNEADVIARAIQSASFIVDGVFVVYDTRTTDNTEKQIKKVCEQNGLYYEIDHFISPKISSREDYVFDFALCRNRAFDMAIDKGYDIGIILDADEVIATSDFNKEDLIHDGYIVDVEYHGSVFDSVRIVNFRKPWRYVAKIHNWLSCDGMGATPKYGKLKVIHYHDGYRSRLPNKVANDVKILKACVTEEPDNARYWFYYAQTLRENGQWNEAIEAYEKRISLGGWDEELFYSTYMIGQIMIFKQDWEESQKWLLRAYQMRPSRSEPLYHLSVFARNKNYRHLGFMFINIALQIPYTSDGLFIEKDIYDYMCLFEYAIHAYWVGRYKESYDANEHLLKMDIPEHIRHQAIENQKYNISKLGLDKKEESFVNLFDLSFQHIKQKYGFDSSTEGVHQKYLNYKRNDYEYEGTTLVTDFMINEPLINQIKSKDIRFWLLEPRSRKQEIYELAEMLSHNNRVTEIYTCDDTMLKNEKAVLTLAGGSWIDGLQDGLPRIPKKSKFTSFVCSQKNDNPYHNFRIECFNGLKKEYVDVDFYGWDEWVKPAVYLDDYMFSIIVENDEQDHYFTEKIINCFRKGVVPIYFGARKIDHYFNQAGIIKFVDYEHLKSLLSMLTEKDYLLRREAIRENFLLAERYISREASLARRFNAIYWDNPFDYFDHIYIITLHDIPERYNNAVQLRAQINVDHCEIFKAIHHKIGGLGCNLSFRACIQDAKEKGYEKVMIFEDDCFLVDDYKYYMTEAVNLLSTIEWEHFKMMGMQLAITEPVSAYLHRLKSGYTLSAAAFHSNVYDMILQNISDDPNQSFRDYIDIFDVWVNENIIPRNKSYMMPKMIAKVKNYESIIEGPHNIDINKKILMTYDNFVMTKHIYFNEGMSTFGNNYMRYHRFVRTSLQYSDVPGLLWFGIYSEEELKRIISCVHNINLHWCGSDTVFAAHFPELMHLLAEKDNINHTCENDLHQGELRVFGIDATVSPMMSEPLNKFSYYEGEKTNDVLVYTPDRHELYNVPLMIDVAKAIPEVNFIFIGDPGALKSLPDNVLNKGWIEQDEVNDLIQKSKIYLRITEHDGFADLTVKSLLMGTHVITNYDFPHVHNKRTQKDIIDTIKLLITESCDPKISEFYRDSSYINNWDVILKYRYNDTE